jgi:hypothetical protein
MLSAARNRQGAVAGAWETEPLLLAMDKPLAINNRMAAGNSELWITQTVDAAPRSGAAAFVGPRAKYDHGTSGSQ